MAKSSVSINLTATQPAAGGGDDPIASAPTNDEIRALWQFDETQLGNKTIPALHSDGREATINAGAVFAGEFKSSAFSNFALEFGNQALFPTPEGMGEYNFVGPHGDQITPYGKIGLSANQIGTVTVDITALGERLRTPATSQGVVIRAGTPNANVRIHSRNGSGQKPRIAYYYADGTDEIIEADQDVHVSASTSMGVGESALLLVTASNLQKAFIHFPPPRKALSKATLVLEIEKNFASSPTMLDVWAVRLGFEDSPSSKGYLEQEPNLYWHRENIADEPELIEAGLADGGENLTELRFYDPILKQNVVRTSLNRGLSGRSFSFKIPLWHGYGLNPQNEGTYAEALRVRFGYWIMFESSFDSPADRTGLCEGGKWAGFCSTSKDDDRTFRSRWAGQPLGSTGSLLAGNGGGYVGGNDGWSMRGSQMPGFYRTHPTLRNYVPVGGYYVYFPSIRPPGSAVTYLHQEARKRRGYYRTTVIGGGDNSSNDAAAEAAWFADHPESTRAFRLPDEALAWAGSESSGTGQEIRANQYGRAILKRDQWHYLEHEIVVNTVNEDKLQGDDFRRRIKTADECGGFWDGACRTWVDGKLTLDRVGLCLRYAGPYKQGFDTELGCRAIWFNGYHGGTLVPWSPAYFRLGPMAVKVDQWGRPITPGFP